MNFETSRPNSVRRRVRLVNWFLGRLLITAASTRIVRPRVEGRENLRNLQGPVILTANHLSSFDIPALAGLIARYRRDVTFLSMAELFQNPVAGTTLEWFGIIPVYRGTDRAAEASNQGVVVLLHGGVVIVFIEGKISSDGNLLPARNGVSFMALKTGATVIPIAMSGTERVKPLRSPWYKWGWFKRYAVVIGKPIRVERNENATADDRKDLTSRIMGQIEPHYERAKVLATQ